MKSFDTSRSKSFDNPKVEVQKDSFPWASFATEDLIAYRDQILEALSNKGVALTLMDIDMEQELLLQYHSLRVLQSKVIESESVPVNQIAQVCNSLSGTLAKVSDLQNSTYDSERLKKIESILIRALRLLPEEPCAAFLDEYAKLLGQA